MGHAPKLDSVAGFVACFVGSVGGVGGEVYGMIRGGLRGVALSVAMHGDSVTRLVWSGAGSLARSVAMCDGFVANFV